MKIKYRLVSATFLVISLLSTIQPAASGQKIQSGDGVRLRTDLVQFDVVVKDKSGKLVTGLKKEDFIVTEDGKPQQVEFLSMIKHGKEADRREAGSGSSAEAQDGLVAEQGRTVFIIFDSSTSFENRPRLREGLVKFITEQLGPEDQVSMISLNGGLSAFRSATKNKLVLRLVIDSMLRKGADYRDSVSATSDRPDGLGDIDRESYLEAFQDLSSKDYNTLLRDLAETRELEQKVRLDAAALARLATFVGDVPGRKLAIYVSEYIAPPSTENWLTDAIRKSRRAGLVIYALDPRGLVATVLGGTAATHRPKTMFEDGSNRNNIPRDFDNLSDSQLGMRYVSKDTGGFAILNNNDLSLGLARVVADNNAYYLVSYYPTNTDEDGKFRRVKIKVKNRPDLSIQTRLGYYAADSKAKTKELSIQEKVNLAASSLVPLREHRVKITSTKTGSTGEAGQRVVSFAARVIPSETSFTQAAGRNEATFEVLTFVSNLEDRVVDQSSRVHTVNLLNNRYEEAAQEGVEITGELKVERPGLYQIRVIVIDKNTGRMGSANEWVIQK